MTSTHAERPRVQIESRVLRIATAAIVLAAVTSSPVSGDDRAPLSVRITSPLGRMGASAKVRIVAQIRTLPDATLNPVKFYVDGALLGSDENGPPYAMEWVDENPFEKREIAVVAADDLGHEARDSIVLPPFDIVEVSQVTSVLLEAGVYDKRGRFVNGLTAPSFAVVEDGVPQTIDVVNHEALAATFALLIDSSQSMHRRIDFVRDAAKRLVEYLRPRDRVLVAPFSRHLAAITGPTDDRATVIEAVEHIQAAGSTAILDSLAEVAQKLPADETRRAIVLITDGYDETSSMPFEEAIAAVKAARTTVYVVGIGGIAGISIKGERVLRRIAAESGGQVFFPAREEELVTVHERLAVDAQNRYLVTYTPTNQKLDGAWRTVSLTTAPEYKVRARTGYLAPKPPPIRPELEFTITHPSQRQLDLVLEDLIVVEDGIEQNVEAFHEAVAPVSIVLALDSSGSMKQSAPGVMEAARGFVGTLRPEDALALLLFADQSVFAHDLSTNREMTLKAIDGYQAIGGTALYDGLADSLNRLQRVEGRRVVVVVSDGRDENNAGTAPGSVRNVDDVLTLVAGMDTTIFTIGFGKVDRAFLERIARMSGGEAYFPDSVEGLKDEYRRIIENLRRRYVVSYTSTNGARDGSWRKVQIRSRSSDAVVASRGGYFAPVR